MDWIFRQECVYKRRTGTDGWNKPTYADPVPTKCRCQFKWQLIKDAHGQEVMSKAQFWVPSNIQAKPGDVLVYQDEEHIVITSGDGVSLVGKTEYLKVWC